MKNDPKELFFDRGPKYSGIFPYPVDADIDLPDHGMTGLGKGKCNNIGIKIVLKEFAVDFQQSVVGHKNILKFGQFLPFFLKKGDDGCPDPSTIPQGNFLQKMKPDSRRDCHNFTAPR